LSHRLSCQRDSESNHQFSHRRDGEILQAINAWGSMDIQQIKYLFFPSLVTARRRMNRMADMKKVNRVRLAVDSPYFYYIGKRPGQLEHRIGTNYARLFLHQWEQILSWEYEPTYLGIVRPDGFCSTQNSFFFVEFDRGFDPFDKVQKYNSLYHSGQYKKAWWINQAKRFPVVMVITSDEVRKRAIDKLLKDSEVEFRVYLYKKVKEALLWEKS